MCPDPHQITLRRVTSAVACGTYGGKETRIQNIGGETCKKRRPLEYPDADDRVTVKWTLGIGNDRASTGLMWFRISKCGGLLCTWQ